MIGVQIKFYCRNILNTIIEFLHIVIYFVKKIPTTFWVARCSCVKTTDELLADIYSMFKSVSKEKILIAHKVLKGLLHYRNIYHNLKNLCLLHIQE